MLSLAEYVAYSKQVEQLGISTESKIADQLKGGVTDTEARALAKGYGADYWAEYTKLFDEAMEEVADNALSHYAEQLGVDVPDGLKDKIIQKQFSDKYYGATLEKRLVYNLTLLQKRIDLAGRIDAKHLTTTYSQYPMFGSQTVTDKRLLLGTMVKIENDAAKEMAGQGDIPFLRWTLSHRHAQTDICDDLASNIDKSVVAWISEKGLKIDPKGLYFAKDLPEPPHPNCQCEFGMVREREELKPGRLERAVDKVKRLLRKISGR